MDDARDRFRILLHPSRMLVLALASAYAGAGVCLWLLDLGLGVKGLMFAFLILSGLCDLCIHTGAQRRLRVREITFHSSGDWQLSNGTGKVLHGKPIGHRLVHPLAVCFSIRLDSGEVMPVLVLGDMCRADAFRELRVWLSVHGEGGQDAIARARPLLNMGRRNGFRS